MKIKLSKLMMLFAVVSLTFQSCKTNQLVSNGAYSDISLIRTADQYEIKRLEEINTEGKAIFGIPIDKNVGNRFGTVVRFNGVELGGTTRLLPILTMVVTSIAVGIGVRGIFGNKTETINDGYGNYTYGTDERKVGLVPSIIIGLPISGTINTLIWPQSSTRRAFQKFNRKLVQDNEDIDVFLNPKYEISTQNGIWSSKTTIKGRVMGATIKL